MSSYVNVTIDELQIDDRVRNLGRLVSDVTDHDMLEGYIVAMFELRGEESIIVRKSGTIVKVRVEDDRYAEGERSDERGYRW